MAAMNGTRRLRIIINYKQSSTCIFYLSSLMNKALPLTHFTNVSCQRNVLFVMRNAGIQPSFWLRSLQSCKQHIPEESEDCAVQIFIHHVLCLVTMTPRRSVLPPLSTYMQAGISSFLHKHTQLLHYPAENIGIASY